MLVIKPSCHLMYDIICEKLYQVDTLDVNPTFSSLPIEPIITWVIIHLYISPFIEATSYI